VWGRQRREEREKKKSSSLTGEGGEEGGDITSHRKRGFRRGREGGGETSLTLEAREITSSGQEGKTIKRIKIHHSHSITEEK